MKLSYLENSQFNFSLSFSTPFSLVAYFMLEHVYFLKLHFWDFCDALHQKSLCFFGVKLRIWQPEVENGITLKRLKVET